MPEKSVENDSNQKFSASTNNDNEAIENRKSDVKNDAHTVDNDDVIYDWSAHGLTILKRHKSHLPLKLIYLAFIIVAWSVCIAHIVQSINRYLLFDVHVNVHFVAEGYEFPAVTICNLSPVRRSAVNVSIIEAPDEFNRDTKLNHAKQTDKLTGLSHHDMLEAELRYMLHQEQITFTEVGHRVEDIIVECTFHGHHCDAKKAFHYWPHGTYGACYTFDIKSTERANFVGPNYGLTLVLYANQPEYMPHQVETIGFRVETHHHAYPPMPAELGISVGAGFSTAIAMKKQRVSRLDLAYLGGATCGYGENLRLQIGKEMIKRWRRISGSLNYTQLGCIKSCLSQHFLHECGCVDSEITPYEFVNTTLRACHYANETEQLCKMRVMAQIEAGVYCNYDHCPQPCNHVTYDMRTTAIKWPRKSYLDNKLLGWKQRSPALANATLEQAQHGLAVVDVYFADFECKLTEQVRAMDIYQLLSDIGGTMGLYAGMSFLTLIELFDVFCTKTKELIQMKKVNLIS